MYKKRLNNKPYLAIFNVTFFRNLDVSKYKKINNMYLRKADKNRASLLFLYSRVVLTYTTARVFRTLRAPATILTP